MKSHTRNQSPATWKRILRTGQNYFPSLKRAKDISFIYGRRLLRRPHEPDFYILARLCASPDEVLLDVGANHGQTIDSLRLCGPQGARIIAFEPNLINAERLLARYGRVANVCIKPIGLADVAGEYKLYVPIYNGFVYDGLASLERGKAEDWLNPSTILGFNPSRLAISEHQCRVETLDSLNLSPSFIKVDVQGYELQVLEGAIKTIEKHQPALLIEDFAGNPRIDFLMQAMDYDVNHVFNGRIVHGAGKGDNTLLLPRKRQRFSS